jgi:tetratricopeptide (TPR) repeat protein
MGRRGLSFILCLSLGLPAAVRAQGRTGTQSEAKEALAEATSLFLSGKVDEADPLYKKAIQLDANLTEAYEAYSNSLFVQKKYKEGEQIAREGLKHSSDSAALKGRLAMHIYQQRRLAEALPLFKEVVPSLASKFEVQALAGQCCLQLGDAACASAAFENYLTSRPAPYAKNDHLVRGNLARAYLQQGVLDKAEAAASAAVRSQPDYEPAELVLSEIYLRRKDCSRAVVGFEKVLAKSPGQAGALRLLLGQTYLCLKRYKEALAQSEEFVKANASSVDGLLLRGEISFELGMNPKALADFERVFAIAPKTPLVKLRIARVHFKQGKFEKALEAIEPEAARADADPEVLVLGVKCALRVKKNPVALELSKRLVERKSPTAEHYYIAGMVQSSTGAFEEATKLFEKALARDKTHRGAKQELVRSICYLARKSFRKGELDEVVKALDRARAVDPESLVVNRDLALAYLKKDKPEKSLELLNKLLKKTPRDFVTNRLAGWALLKLRRFAEAQSRFDTAVASMLPHPGTPLARVLAESAVNQMRLGGVKRALVELRRAEELATGDKDAAALLVVVQQNLTRLLVQNAQLSLTAGKTADAWKDLETALPKLSSLPPEERTVVYVFAGLVAYSAGKAAEGKPLIAKASGDIAAALKAPFGKLGKKLVEGLAGYLDPDIGAKQKATAQLEKLAARLPAEAKAQLLELAGSGYEQVAERLFLSGKAKPARQILAKAKLQAGTPRYKHNAAILDYATGQRGPAVAELESLRGKAPLASCNLGVHFENAGDSQRAYELFRDCEKKGGAYPELKEIIESKRRVLGEAK